MVGTRGDELTSPELQEHQVREYCARRGYEVISWLCDVDMTGRSWSRRQIESAVKRIEAGEADLIVVPRWSRFTRNLRDYVIQTARIEAAGGRLESALEETDPATAAGLLQRDLFAVLAQWESRLKGEQWKETHQRRRDAGHPHNNRPRLGYLYQDHQYVVNPAEVAIVEELYSRYLQGMGWRPLARWLGSQGIRSKYNPGAEWSHHGVMGMMDTGFAAGFIRAYGQSLPGVHEPIIDLDTWAQYLEARKGRHYVAPRHVTPTTALASLMVCEGCNARMMIRSGGKSQQYGRRYWYGCMRWPDCPSRAGVTRARAERFVQGWLRELMGESARRTALRVVRDANSALKSIDRTALLDKLAEVEAGLDTLEEQFLLRRYTAERRDRLAARLEAQRDGLITRLAETAERPAPKLPDPDTIGVMLEVWDEMPVAELNLWLKSLIRQVRVERIPKTKNASLMQVVATWDA